MVPVEVQISGAAVVAALSASLYESAPAAVPVLAAASVSAEERWEYPHARAPASVLELRSETELEEAA